MRPRGTACLALSLGLLWASASAASAQVPGALTGTYTGTYRCSQGATNLKLTLLATPDGSVFGTFTFYLPAGTQKDAYTYSIQGTFNPATQKFVLAPVKWETAAPPDFGMVGLNGTFDSNELTGTVTSSGCTTFNVERMRAAVSPADTRTVQPAPLAAAPAPPPSSPRAPAPSAPIAAPESQPARVSRAQQPAEPAASKPTPRSTAPRVNWLPDKKSPQTALKSDPMFVGSDAAVFVEAVCASNGAGIRFRIYDRKGDNGPQFDHHEDPSPVGAKADIVDIDVIVDGKSHVAKGFLTVTDDSQYVNDVGLLFYDPGLPVRARGERRLEVRTGTPLDKLTQPLALLGADAEIEEGLRTSAGPLSDLVNARSIEMHLPILKSSTSTATFELAPQSPVMHEFASKCLGGSPSTAPAPAPRPPSGPLSR